MNHHPASDELLAWLRGLSGALTNAKTTYGSYAEMIENPDWDDRKTELTIRLIGALRDHLDGAQKELEDHVSSKFG